MQNRGSKTTVRHILEKMPRLGIWMIALLVSISLIQVGVLRFYDPPLTFSIIWDSILHRIQSKPYRSPHFIWTPLESVSPHLQRAVLAAEDQRFLHHHGFDMIEIRAAAKDIVRQQRLRGASTISMQTARTVFLLPVRSLWRKALEAYYTALIELLWNKRRIIEVYLNTVDWGSGIMGAEAASRRYFKKSSRDLTPHQAALLAAVLPNPHRLSPIDPDSHVKMRARKIMSDMPLMRSL
ncbi:MAG: monofunctional biosynthetic peptidoglycan transglycosylase [Desulfobacteraceae bacterium]|nr:MAG: monofunctional biosynthetic peptidoglycan transglycosylase [Desulfobacteraceae bacterium]